MKHPELCDRCGNFLEFCECKCPYCGEKLNCKCAIGSDKATGG